MSKMTYKQATYDEPLIFELGKPGRRGHLPPKTDVPPREITIPSNMKRKEPPQLPEIHEGEVVRHYLHLSQMNYCVDTGIYPLGSCTMKYNPKINEALARNEKLCYIHPYQPEETVQGILELIYNLQKILSELAGLPYCTLQPAAGAAGEYLGLNLIRAYHHDRGDYDRIDIITPDSSHGTNPASTVMNGFNIIEIESNKDGQVDLEALKAVVSEKTAGFMITNPNTLGIFESQIEEISKIIHDAGGLLYYDGANFNAIVGMIRPGEMGFDVLHFNLHKTFSTPHGGGGPGSGAVCCSERLSPYLPVPIVEFDKANNRYFLNYDIPKTVGKIHGYYGNIAIALRGYAYICALGADGLIETSRQAVLNANYVMRKLEEIDGLVLKYNRELPRKHECVLDATPLKHEIGVGAMDIAKMLISRGYHAPTVLFPLIVHEALMIEPTENENKESLDRYIQVFKEEIAKAKENPQYAHDAPYNTAVGRVDDAWATRNLILSWKMIKELEKKGQWPPQWPEDH